MTAGIAAASPAAVATSASAMPGAYAARLAVPLTPMPRKAFMMPQTVPNSPMNGVALAVVAKKPRLRSNSASCTDAFLRRTRLNASSPSRWATLPSGDGLRLISRNPAR
jgi:hypothetical protein